MNYSLTPSEFIALRANKFGQGGRGSASLHRRFKNSLIQKTWFLSKYVLTLMRMRDIIIVSVIYGLSWTIHTKKASL